VGGTQKNMKFCTKNNFKKPYGKNKKSKENFSKIFQKHFCHQNILRYLKVVNKLSQYSLNESIGNKQVNKYVRV